jgi:MFS family permease
MRASWLRSLLPFVVMCVGMFIALLDIQIVASSLQDIGGGLSAAQDQISWVQTAYLIAEIVMIPLSGWLTRVFSTRWLFTASAAGGSLETAGFEFVLQCKPYGRLIAALIVAGGVWAFGMESVHRVSGIYDAVCEMAPSVINAFQSATPRNRFKQSFGLRPLPSCSHFHAYQARALSPASISAIRFSVADVKSAMTVAMRVASVERL